MDDLVWQTLHEELGRGTGSARDRRDTATPALDDDFDHRGSRGLEEDEDYIEGHTRKKISKPAKRKSGMHTIANEEDINLPAYQDMDMNFLGDEPSYSIDDPLQPHDDAFGLNLGLDFDTGLEGPLPDLGASSSSGGHASIAGVAEDSRPLPIPNSGDLNRAREVIPETPAGVGEFEFEGNDFMDVDLGLPTDVSPDFTRSPEQVHAGKSVTPGAPPTPPPSSEKKRVAKSKNPAKAKKPRLALKDTVTVLQSENLATSGNLYTVEMDRLNEQRDIERYDTQQRQKARSMMCDIPKDIGAPELRNFLEKAYNLDHFAKATHKTVLSSEKGHSPIEQGRIDALAGKNRERRDREGTAVSSQMGRHGAYGDHNAEPAEFDMMDYSGGGNDFDFGDPVTYERNDPAMDDMHDRDMSRRSLPSSAGGRMHDTAFSREYEQESNYGRNRPGHSMNVSASQSMPWNQIEGVSPFLKGLGGYSSTSRSFSHRPSFAGTSDRRSSRSRSPSLGLSIHRGRLGRASSISPAAVFRATSASLSGQRGMMSNFDNAMEMDIAGDLPSPGLSPVYIGGDSPSTGMGSQRSSNSQEETTRFLQYAKHQAGPTGEDFFFSDIVPVVETSPNVAAMAFYHLLVLASKEKIKIKAQLEPYGEIELAIP